MIIEAWEPIWGGGQVHAFELCQRLSKDHGCQIDLYTMNLDEKKSKEEFVNGNFRIIRTGRKRSFTFTHRIFWIFDFLRELKKNHKSAKYDIVHAQASLPGFHARVIKTLYKIPIVYTVHGTNLLDLGKKNAPYLIEKILCTKLKYDAEISVNGKFLEYKNVNKPSVIPNGVDIEKFEEASGKYISQKDKKIFKILFVGRLDKVKGVDILIKSVKNIEQELKNRNVRISLVGYGYEEEKFRSLASSLALDNLIEFKGKLLGKNLLKEYATADLFILPSRSEGQPLTLLEAWAAKLPVIVTNVGDNELFVKNSINGWIIPPQDVNALSKKILEAVKNPRLEEFGTAGFDLVKEKYSWDNAANKTYEVYKQVLK